MITRVVQQLSRTDLRPGPAVDALFAELVALAGAADRDHPWITDPVALARIRRICAVGETRLEEFWAAEIVADPGRLAAFPYLANYRALAAAEHRALRTAASGPLRHIVFAGCGPLPLTALELHALAPDLRITCLDLDPVAVDRAREVIRALTGDGRPGTGTAVTVEVADAGTFDYGQADAVLVAALVGSTPVEKLGLLDRIARTLGPGVLLAARSVPDDGRQLLYPRLDPAAVASTMVAEATAVTVLTEWLPPPGVINSLLLLRMLPR